MADPPYGAAAAASPASDPWEDTETAHLRDFLKLTYSERFHLMMQALEFMNMLRPAAADAASVSSSEAAEQKST